MSESGHTIDTLKELHDERINHLEEKFALQFRLNQLAIDKAESKMDQKMEGINEWRAQNKDERSMFASKEQVDGNTRLIYIGLGIVVTLQFIIGIAIALYAVYQK